MWMGGEKIYGPYVGKECCEMVILDISCLYTNDLTKDLAICTSGYIKVGPSFHLESWSDSLFDHTQKIMLGISFS